MMKTRWNRRLNPWLWVTVFLLPATYYLWLPGLQTTMDGLYHTSRLFELDWLLRLGVLYPRWLPHQGFLYGFPTLHFYAPLIYYVAEGFHLVGFGFLASYEWMIGLGIVAAGWSMFTYARRWGPWTGWLAAVAYTYWVYHIALAYVRGAQAELWGMVWFPLVLAFIHDIFHHQERFPGNRHLALALSYALLMLTHNLSALLFTPVAAAYALWLTFLSGEDASPAHVYLSRLLQVAASMILGLVMAAFYWLPVLTDVRYVHAGRVHSGGLIALLQSLRPMPKLLSPYWIHRYQLSPTVRNIAPLGRMDILLWLSGLGLALFLWRRRSREYCLHLVFSALLTTTAILGMSTWSTWFWTHIPFLYYLQFPWRLGSLVGLGLALSMGLTWGDGVRALVRSSRRRWGGYALAAGLALALGVSGLGGIIYDIAKNPATWQPLKEKDVNLALIVQYDYLVGLAEREHGGVWPFEYLPIWAVNAASDFFLPPQSPPADTIPERVTVVPGRQHPYDRRFRVQSPIPWVFSFHQFYFPAWQVEVDGRDVPTRPEGDLGLVAADIPAGDHEVRLRYTATQAQRVAGVLALVGGLLWLGLALRRDRRWLAVPLLVGVYFLSATAPAWTSQTPGVEPRPRSVLLGDRIRLIGSRVITPEVRPGGRVWFTLDWLALAPPRRRYKVIVHLTDQEGNTVANGDTEPGFFFTPTTRWQQGEIMEDWYSVRVPENTPPGTYLLLTGMYDAETVQNLPITGEAPVAGRVLVGNVIVGQTR